MMRPTGLAYMVVAMSLFLIPAVHGNCEDFKYDCSSCLQDGCYYCPGDALCYSTNQPDNTDYTDDKPYTRLTNCPTPEDYLFSGDSCETPGAVFSDPEYAGQSWVYDMINVVPVWEQGITGTGVRVRVNDDGFDPVFVADLGDRFDEANSCANFQATRKNESSHGTNVAAILGASANDNECSVGIAPTVTLSFCDYEVASDSNLLEPNTFTYDISQNSWGGVACDVPARRRFLQSTSCPFTIPSAANGTIPYPCLICEDFSQPSDSCSESLLLHCIDFYKEEPACLDFLPYYLDGNCDYEAISSDQEKALSDGVSLGRQGKGIIYVFASGNEFWQGEERSFQWQGQTRFAISVGAVGQDRLHTTYSTPGTSVFIAGPGGDSESLSNHITTSFGRQCLDATVGTSFACPVVSGVIALVLEVNPDLTWRDVQYVLAQTSQRVDDVEDTTAFQNAAGYWHSNWYGFGIVDAEAAVTAARNWENVGAEQTVLAKTGLLNEPIVDDESSILETSVIVEAPANFVVESVELQLNISSFSRGDLEITLTSPQGTKSVLHAGRRPENTQTEASWRLLTVRHWGEDPNGEWTLTIVDLVKGDVDNCISQNWTLDNAVSELYYDCYWLEFDSLCVDGQLNPNNNLDVATYDEVINHQSNSLLPSEACCACGGGLDTNEVVDQLEQWTLAIYGTDDPVRHPLAPSPAPGPSSSGLDGASTIFGLTVVFVMGSFVLRLT